MQKISEVSDLEGKKIRWEMIAKQHKKELKSTFLENTAYCSGEKCVPHTLDLRRLVLYPFEGLK